MENFTGRFVNAETKDNIELLGLLSESNAGKTIVVHFHGMQGNFFKNNFIQNMLVDYPEKGVSFLTVEQRGAEAVRFFPKGDQYLKGGNAFENFGECRHDIKAWIDFARSIGYENIYLQGHSLGCSKIAYYLAESDSDIEGAIFISPADMHGIFIERVKNGSKLLQEAKEMSKEGKGEEILVEQCDGWKYLSANTFIDLYSEDSDTAIFNFLKPELGFETLEDIETSILAITGSKDAGIVTEPEKSMKMLEEKTINASEIKTKVLEDAEHDFRGFEKEIIEEVSNYIL